MKLELERTWKTVLVSMLNHRDWRTGLSSPGVSLIAEEVGLSERQVQRILRHLEQAEGAEKITPMGQTLGGQGRTTIYQLHLKGCVLGAAGTVTRRVTFAAKGDIRPDIRPDIGDTRKTNKDLFTGSRSSLTAPQKKRRPQSEKGGSEFARNLANLKHLVDRG